MNAATLEVLDDDECWDLLSTESFGRLAICTQDGADIFPVNYMVTDHAVFFRSAPGTKLMELTANPRVAFEVDGKRGRRRWSVVVRGTAQRLNLDAAIEGSGVLGLVTATDTDKWNYVRVTPGTITGRRVAIGG